MDILLWFDVESAGPDLPDAEKDTVLEAAWCFTRRYPTDELRYRRDLGDYQLTPLRSRFTTLTPPERDGFCSHLRPTAGGYGRAEWPERTGNVQKRMHAASGFDLAHIAAPRDLVIDTGEQLARLIIDDLYRAVAAVDGSLDRGAENRVTLYLAGDGIGHYDRGLMDRECPGVSRHLHYRPLDISVAVQTLSAAQESPTRALLALDDTVRSDFVTALSTLDVDESARTVDGGIAWWLDAACVDPHRAAPDVARAMLAYLIGRYRVGQALSTARAY